MKLKYGVELARMRKELIKNIVMNYEDEDITVFGAPFAEKLAKLHKDLTKKKDKIIIDAIMSNQNPKYCPVHSTPYIDGACPKCTSGEPPRDWLQEEEARLLDKMSPPIYATPKEGPEPIDKETPETLKVAQDRAMDLAAKGIYGPKNEDYGPASLEFQKMAQIHDIIWPEGFYTCGGGDMVNHALYMIILKCVREVNAHKKDNFVDIIGYAQLADDAYDNE